MVNVGAITPNAAGFVSGVLTVSLNNVPQYTNYTALYRRFKILKCQWTLIPRFNSVDLGTAQYNQLVVGGAVAAWSAGRFVYAVDDTPNAQAPISELDVLQSNGARIVMGQKKIVISHRPVPLLASYTGALGAGMTFSKRSQPWLNTDNPTGGNSAIAMAHYGIRYAFSQPVTGTSPTPYAAYDIFAKITFTLADPA